MRKYILNEKGNPVEEPNLLTWGAWFETSDRVVAKDTVGESEISTVFLGMDHSMTGDRQPILWETIVFGGTLAEEMDRCSGSREQAEAMHAKMVERVIGIEE